MRRGRQAPSQKRAASSPRWLLPPRPGFLFRLRTQLARLRRRIPLEERQRLLDLTEPEVPAREKPREGPIRPERLREVAHHRVRAARLLDLAEVFPRGLPLRVKGAGPRELDFPARVGVDRKAR